MIWFFLAGMIAGAVGMIMYAKYKVRKGMTFIRIEEDEDETGHPDKDVPGN